MLSSALPTLVLTLCHWAILMSFQLTMVFNCWPRDAMMLSEVKAPISATSGDLSAAEACPAGGEQLTTPSFIVSPDEPHEKGTRAQADDAPGDDAAGDGQGAFWELDSHHQRTRCVLVVAAFGWGAGVSTGGRCLFQSITKQSVHGCHVPCVPGTLARETEDGGHHEAGSGYGLVMISGQASWVASLGRPCGGM